MQTEEADKGSFTQDEFDGFPPEDLPILSKGISSFSGPMEVEHQFAYAHLQVTPPDKN